MFPFGLSLFNIGLTIVIIVLVVLYLIVLIKLKSPTEGGGIPKKDLSRQGVSEGSSTERRSKPQVYNETREEFLEGVEPVELEESVERPEPLPPPPIETEKSEIPGETRNSGCPHHFGYLREHPKNTPIPNEFLTCIKIMECLSKGE